MTDPSNRAIRRDIAERMRSQIDAIARSVTDEFLEQHPDWIGRYGSLARVRGEEDAKYHIRFLAGAIISDSLPAFESYARWTAGVLDARGIKAGFLIENLNQVGRAARKILADEEGRALVDRWIAAAVDAVGQTRPATSAPGSTQDEWSIERNLYLQAIVSGQRHAAVNIVTEAIHQGASVPDLYQHVLQPAQYELGHLWERNEITVATEHMATAITQLVMAQLYMNLDLPDATHGNAIVTGVNEELHQIGAHMVSDVLAAAGWNVRFLGTQLPHPDIVAAVEDHGAMLVGISTTVIANLSSVSDLIERLRASFGQAITILVGGGAYRAEPEIWREIGADGFAADLRAAVDLASRFIPKEA